MSIRADVLHKAEKCICNDRETQYGSPEDNFKVISDLWTTYLSSCRPDPVSVSPQDVAIMMALMKIARIKSGTFKEDSFVDAAGYIACGAEVALKSKNVSSAD